MRLWIGKEAEGAQKGEMTLFVECKKLTNRDIEKIQNKIKTYRINRVYFGAGKKDLKYYEKIECIKAEKIIETTLRNIKNVIIKDFDQVIIRFDVTIESYDKIRLKLDNGDVVKVYEEGLENSITNVENGMYNNNDILI